MKTKSLAPWNVKPGTRILVPGLPGTGVRPVLVTSVSRFIGPFTGSTCYRFHHACPITGSPTWTLYHGKTRNLPAERVAIA